MALLPILRYPDPRLATVAQPVVNFDANLSALSQDMLETMYQAQGIGLAATQVNRHIRLVVMDLSEERNQPLVLVNPNIKSCSAERAKGSEGCLSVPDIRDEVERALSLTLQAQDLQGQFFELQAEDLMAICIQHEIDHLNGIVFVQHLSRLKQDRIRTKLRKADTVK